MRVLHVVASLDPVNGGPAVNMLPLARALSRVPDTQVSVFSSCPRTEGAVRVHRQKEGAVETALFPVAPGHFSHRRYVAPALVAEVWRRARDFDVIETHGTFTFVSSLSDLASTLHGRVLVMRPCGSLGKVCLEQGSRAKRPYLWALTRPALRRAAFVHCTSDGEAAEVSALEPRARVRVIPHGVDLPAPDVSGTPSLISCPYVLFLGRLHPIKRLEVLLRAFAALAARQPALALVLAGPDEGMRVRLEQRAKESGLSSRVLFTGLVTGPTKDRLLRHAEVLALVSEHENFGATALEAVAHGTPVVVSTGVALHAQVTATGAGEVVPEPDDGALTTALERVLARGKPAYAAACRELARTFSWDAAADRLAAAYREALNDPGRIR